MPRGGGRHRRLPPGVRATGRHRRARPLSVAERIAARIHRLGPIPFADFAELALYDEDAGFFATGGGAGRSRDFLTSPALGPLFGAVLSQALDGWWRELGEPDPYVVVDAGAGDGSLARAVLGAAPACAPALRYVLVERSEVLRNAHGEGLPLEPAAWVLGPAAPQGEDDDDPAVSHVPGSGPLVCSLFDLPAARFTGVVLANELLDNLPPLLVERSSESWHEVRVGEAGGRFVEVQCAAAPDLAADADRFAPGAPVGARIPVQRAAAAWLRDALGGVERGRVVAVDYGATTAEMARRPWTEWVRTFRAGGRGRGPLETPGEQDITCDVALDQLARVRPPAHVSTQAGFLRAHGLDDLVAEARAAAEATAASGDLTHLQARSRVQEAAALTDETGLGAFRVMEWAVP